MAARSTFHRLKQLAFVLVLFTLATVTLCVLSVVCDWNHEPRGELRDTLRALRGSLERGAGHDMQRLFPEGYVFSYALYGLSFTNLARAHQVDVATARREASWAIQHIHSPAGRAAFDPSLTPAHGVFYAGWSLLVRAQAAALMQPLPAPERAQLEQTANQLASAFSAHLDAGISPFLQAYPQQAWPVDSVVAMAALRWTDRALGTDRQPLIARWLKRVHALRDPRTGLLAHRCDPQTGAALEGARGTSQSIIQSLWPVIDAATHAESYARFRALYLRPRFGVLGVQEFPPGVVGEGDVDTGPLLLGYALSASAVAIGSARANGDVELAHTLEHEANVFGFPYSASGERRYLAGQLPIADAFIAWARSTPPAERATPLPRVHVYWPAYLVLPWLFVLVAWRLQRKRSTRSAEG